MRSSDTAFEGLHSSLRFQQIRIMLGCWHHPDLPARGALIKGTKRFVERNDLKVDIPCQLEIHVADFLDDRCDTSRIGNRVTLQVGADARNGSFQDVYVEKQSQSIRVQLLSIGIMLDPNGDARSQHHADYNTSKTQPISSAGPFNYSAPNNEKCHNTQAGRAANCCLTKPIVPFSQHALNLDVGSKFSQVLTVAA